MVKSKGKVVINEPWKLQTLEDNVRKVDQKLCDFMAEIYDAHCQTKEFLDQWFEQLAEILQGGVRLGESSLHVKSFF